MSAGGTIPCGVLAELATAYLDGALPRPERERIEGHLAGCLACGAYLAELRLVIEASGRLGAADSGGADPARAAAVALFRRHGLHGDGARIRDLPLGIGEHAAATGEHIAYLWESERDFLAVSGFLVAGFERDEACVLLGRGPSKPRLFKALERLGVSPARLTRENRLHVLSPGPSGEALLATLDERVKDAIDRGLVGVRVLGDLGWDEPGWPSVHELLTLEARVTDAVRRYPALVMCAYDVGRLPARTLLKGGFECHPSIVHRGVLRANDAYVAAGKFLAELEGESVGG
jgi:hypothetical protein